MENEAKAQDVVQKLTGQGDRAARSALNTLADAYDRVILIRLHNRIYNFRAEPPDVSATDYLFKDSIALDVVTFKGTLNNSFSFAKGQLKVEYETDKILTIEEGLRILSLTTR